MNWWIIGGLVLLAVLLALGLRRRKAADQPPVQPAAGLLPRRNAQSVRRGYRAHAADLWGCDPEEVTEAMEAAAKRDLYAMAYGATMEHRQRVLAENPEVPPVSALVGIPFKEADADRYTYKSPEARPWSRHATPRRREAPGEPQRPQGEQ